MDLALPGQRAQDLKVTRRQAREAEQRDPVGQIDQRAVVGQPLAGPPAALRRAGESDPGSQPPPELRLPRRPGRKLAAGGVGVAPGSPGLEHLGAVKGITIEQPRQVADDAQPAGLADRVRLAGGTPEVGGEDRQPGLLDARVHDIEQRPGRALR